MRAGPVQLRFSGHLPKARDRTRGAYPAGKGDRTKAQHPFPPGAENAHVEATGAWLLVREGGPCCRHSLESAGGVGVAVFVWVDQDGRLELCMRPAAFDFPDVFACCDGNQALR